MQTAKSNGRFQMVGTVQTEGSIFVKNCYKPNTLQTGRFKKINSKILE